MINLEIAVCRAGREIDRIVRPLREFDGGPAVTYRRQLWRVTGDSIHLEHGPLNRDMAPSDDAPQANDSSDAVNDQGSLLAEPHISRILVDAGPGTGKTYVACARVAAMIRDGVPAARIWIISFTRTAVIELRNRIAGALDDPADASAVRIATLDSHAWALQSGFSSQIVLSGSYEESIAQTLSQVCDDDDVAEYLQRLRHLIVDEAQDIIGVRADLTLAIVDALEPECGVTAFADEAQAIYGFTEDAQANGEPSTSLLDGLRERGFQERSLVHVHRTDSPTLREIFTSVRRRVMGRRGSASARRLRVREEIERLSDGMADATDSLDIAALPGNALVLMRRRLDVLLASSYAKAPHRLRMSGLPACVGPWIALILWDWTDRRMTRSAFEERWAARCSPSPPGTPDRQTAWQLLLETAGDSATTIDLHRLRAVLGRSTPPLLFCSPEFGLDGPVLGTIHASKGREASEVLLYLPPDDDRDKDADDEEEIRVMFVGATRARDQLRVGTSSSRKANSVHGRVWRWVNGGKVQVELGRARDVEPDGLVGRVAFATPDDAKKAQRAWLNAPLRTGLIARARRDVDWKLSLEDNGQRLAVLSTQVSEDLRQIAQECGQWPPPSFLPHLRSIGLRTLVVSPDSAWAEQLHEPWRSSGFLIAPLLLGFSTAKFSGNK